MIVAAAAVVVVLVAFLNLFLYTYCIKFLFLPHNYLFLHHLYCRLCPQVCTHLSNLYSYHGNKNLIPKKKNQKLNRGTKLNFVKIKLITQSLFRHKLGTISEWFFFSIFRENETKHNIETLSR